jgi:hypothetical protein
VYVDASDFPGAYTLAGRYRVEGSGVTTSEKQVGNFTLVGEAGDMDTMTAEIVSEAQRLTKGSQ